MLFIKRIFTVILICTIVFVPTFVFALGETGEFNISISDNGIKKIELKADAITTVRELKDYVRGYEGYTHLEDGAFDLYYDGIKLDTVKNLNDYNIIDSSNIEIVYNKTYKVELMDVANVKYITNGLKASYNYLDEVVIEVSLDYSNKVTLEFIKSDGSYLVVSRNSNKYSFTMVEEDIKINVVNNNIDASFKAEDSNLKNESLIVNVNKKTSVNNDSISYIKINDNTISSDYYSLEVIDGNNLKIVVSDECIRTLDDGAYMYEVGMIDEDIDASYTGSLAFVVELEDASVEEVEIDKIIINKGNNLKIQYDAIYGELTEFLLGDVLVDLDLIRVVGDYYILPLEFIERYASDFGEYSLVISTYNKQSHTKFIIKGAFEIVEEEVDYDDSFDEDSYLDSEDENSNGTLSDEDKQVLEEANSKVNMVIIIFISFIAILMVGYKIFKRVD